jgi:hypothetical protein
MADRWSYSTSSTGCSHTQIRPRYRAGRHRCERAITCWSSSLTSGRRKVTSRVWWKLAMPGGRWGAVIVRSDRGTSGMTHLHRGEPEAFLSSKVTSRSAAQNR